VAEIVLDHVSKRFPDGTMAVSDVNLDIGDGEFVILVGPSGSGKSTCLNMIAGLEDISEGQLRIGDRVVNDLQPKDRDIAMVFQNYALYPHMTVRENMAFALKLAKTGRAEIDQKVNRAAQLLELTPFLDRRPANLSGGQRQRVAMGRAIVRSPQAFLMDEPLSNLDAKLRVQMRTTISRLHNQLGTTTVYVTHDQIEAMTLGDRVAVMRAGVIQQVGHPGGAVPAAPQPVRRRLHRLAGDELPAGDAGRRPAAHPPRRCGAARPGARQGRAGRRRPRPDHGPAAGALRGRRPGQRQAGPGAHVPADIDVLESLGADKDAYFHLQGGRATAQELEEIAADAGSADAPGTGDQIVARLDGASTAREGGRMELWVDTGKLHLFNPDNGAHLTL
jgi:multiple sugar transport system ATP-binding protein